MPSYYSGNPNNITGRSLLNSLSVTNATNACPIVITTSVNHNYNTGDVVALFFIGGNTAANGGWTITVLSATTFALNGSYGNGAFSGVDGLALDVTLNPPYQIPSDGDAFNAAAFNAAYQALGDRTQYLQNQINFGSYVLNSVFFIGTADDTWTSWSTTNTLGGWGNLTNTTDIFDFSFYPVGNLPTCNTGDLFIYTINATASVSGAAVAVAPGIKVLGVGDFTETFGGGQQFQSGFHGGLHLQGQLSVQTGASAASISAYSGNLMTLTGLTGMSSSSVGSWVTIAGAANPTNNGTFVVQNYISSSSVKVVNRYGVYPDANSGSLSWQLNNMEFAASMMGYGASGSITMYGHRLFILRQYRQAQTELFTPTG